MDKHQRAMVQAKFILEAALAYHQTITVYQANIRDRQMQRTELIVYLNKRARLILAQEVQKRHHKQ